MIPKVLITRKVPNNWITELEAIADVTIWNKEEYFLMPRKELLSEIKHYDALINFAEVKADEAFVECAPKLKIIANCSIGFDNLNLPLLTSRGLWATNAPGFFNYPVAEYVLAGILALKRNLLLADDFVRKNEWKNFEPGRWDGISLKFLTLGIVGMGSIGYELKKTAQSLGIKVVYFDPAHYQEEESLPFEELISIADIISIHVPLNESTHNLFSRDAIQKIKKGAILVNTSRGNIIDEPALIDALEAGYLSGAVLDVFANEPRVPDQLKQMKNVLLTPHIAGGTIHAREGCVGCAATNVAATLKGKVPPNALNNPLS